MERRGKYYSFLNNLNKKIAYFFFENFSIFLSEHRPSKSVGTFKTSPSYEQHFRSDHLENEQEFCIRVCIRFFFYFFCFQAKSGGTNNHRNGSSDIS